MTGPESQNPDADNQEIENQSPPIPDDQSQEMPNEAPVTPPINPTPATSSSVNPTPREEPKLEGSDYNKKSSSYQNEPQDYKPTFTGFVKNNLPESIAYVILFAGLILSIFNPVLGGALVGIILGAYFSQEIMDRSLAFKDMVVREGIFRGFIVIAAILALLLEAPGLLLGAIIGAWIRPYLGNTISSPFDKK